MKIDVYKLQRAVGPQIGIEFLWGGGLKCRTLRRLLRCLRAIDGVHVCRCLWEMGCDVCVCVHVGETG